VSVAKQMLLGDVEMIMGNIWVNTEGGGDIITSSNTWSSIILSSTFFTRVGLKLVWHFSLRRRPLQCSVFWVVTA
jgi:hypothetical protein